MLTTIAQDARMTIATSVSHAGSAQLFATRRFAAFREATRRKTTRIVAYLDVEMELLITVWIAVMGVAAVAKVATAPIRPASLGGQCLMALPYLLIALAPVAGYRVTAGSFPRGLISAQPFFRLARIGRWRTLDVIEARRNPMFGPAGFMASLLVGILLNVPVRTAEYLAAVPAIGLDAPAWAHTILIVMSADVIVMNFFYMVCFVMALRSIPLFPRMMVYAWVMDLCMQFAIANEVAHAPNLPPQVAGALLTVLDGNIHKVLISAAIWLPYLLMSERVNVTYRRRCSTMAA